MVIVKDREFPTGCRGCWAEVIEADYRSCFIENRETNEWNNRPDWCPLMDGEQVERELAESYFPKRCQRQYTEEEIKDIEELMTED